MPLYMIMDSTTGKNFHIVEGRRVFTFRGLIKGRLLASSYPEWFVLLSKYSESFPFSKECMRKLTLSDIPLYLSSIQWASTRFNQLMKGELVL